MEPKPTVGERLIPKKSRWASIWKNSYVKGAILTVILVGGVVGFWFGLRTYLKTEFPLLTVASGSMIPTLNIGDLIAVEGSLNASVIVAQPSLLVDSQIVGQGDIIVFHRPSDLSELIVHRAIEKVQRDGVWYFRTQGDAAFLRGDRTGDYWYGDGTWDGRVPDTLVVGKVVGKVPWVGYIPLYLRRPEGIAIIIVLFLLIILLEYIPIKPKKQPAATTEGLTAFTWCPVNLARGSMKAG